MFNPDAVLQVYSESLQDVNPRVHAYAISVVGIDYVDIPWLETLLGYTKVFTMTQFINHIRGFESEALLMNGWDDEDWQLINTELLVASIHDVPAGGFQFRLQSLEQYKLDQEYIGEQTDLAHLYVTATSMVRIAIGMLVEYARIEYGGELMSNDPDQQGGIFAD
jgi:hypothetical protein